MKILFIDDEIAEFARFLKLPFAEEHRDAIQHRLSPVGLIDVVTANPELRLIILDIRWGTDEAGHTLGIDALEDLDRHGCDVPVVIYSMIDSKEALADLLPRAERMGAIDWISKDEPLILRDARFRRAFSAGTEMQRRPRRHAVLSRGESVRHDVSVAILFVDMSGFTMLTDQVGHMETTKILKLFYGVVGQAVNENGGYVDKYIGDAVMAAFVVPDGKGGPNPPHVSSAVAAARSMVTEMSPVRLREIEPVLRSRASHLKPDEFTRVGKLRVGIESGNVEVVRFERGTESEVTFIGTPVNIAARILSQTEPGEIWLGENANSHSSINTINPTKTNYRNLFGDFTRYQIPL